MLFRSIAFDQAAVKVNEDIASGAEPINIDAFEVEYVDNPDDAPSDEQIAEAKTHTSEAQAKAAAAMAAATNPDEVVDTETGEVKTKSTKK